MCAFVCIESNFCFSFLVTRFITESVYFLLGKDLDCSYQKEQRIIKKEKCKAKNIK